MSGKNIKQLTTRTNPADTDFLYIVAGDEDYNVTLAAIKELFGIEDVSWNTNTLTAGQTGYVNTQVDTTNYAVVKLECFFKRGSRTYRSMQITVMYDGSSVIVNPYEDVLNSDNDLLGISNIAGNNPGGQIQLSFDIDGSDANDVTMNWRIISKKPIAL